MALEEEVNLKAGKTDIQRLIANTEGKAERTTRQLREEMKALTTKEDSGKLEERIKEMLSSIDGDAASNFEQISEQHSQTEEMLEQIRVALDERATLTELGQLEDAMNLLAGRDDLARVSAETSSKIKALQIKMDKSALDLRNIFGTLEVVEKVSFGFSGGDCVGVGSALLCSYHGLSPPFLSSPSPTTQDVTSKASKVDLYQQGLKLDMFMTKESLDKVFKQTAHHRDTLTREIKEIKKKLATKAELAQVPTYDLEFEKVYAGLADRPTKEEHEDDMELKANQEEVGLDEELEEKKMTMRLTNSAPLPPPGRQDGTYERPHADRARLRRKGHGRATGADGKGRGGRKGIQVGAQAGYDVPDDGVPTDVCGGAAAAYIVDEPAEQDEQHGQHVRPPKEHEQGCDERDARPAARGREEAGAVAPAAGIAASGFAAEAVAAADAAAARREPGREGRGLALWVGNGHASDKLLVGSWEGRDDGSWESYSTNNLHQTGSRQSTRGETQRACSRTTGRGFP